MNVSVDCYYRIRLFVVHRDSIITTPKPKPKSNKFRPNVAAWRMGKTCIPLAAMMTWNDFGKHSFRFYYSFFLYIFLRLSTRVFFFTAVCVCVVFFLSFILITQNTNNNRNLIAFTHKVFARSARHLLFICADWNSTTIYSTDISGVCCVYSSPSLDVMDTDHFAHRRIKCNKHLFVTASSAKHKTILFFLFVMSKWSDKTFSSP